MPGVETADIEPTWDRLAALAAEALRMDPDEAARFRDNRVAKLVGLLPFAAGCDDAERAALAHLAVYVVAGRGGARAVFDHAPGDDVEPLARLSTIADFPGGDPDVLARGMALLGLCMLAGYRRDAAKDLASGEYNPINSGAWDSGRVEAALLADARAVDPGVLDAIMTETQALEGYWEI